MFYFEFFTYKKNFLFSFFPTTVVRFWYQRNSHVTEENLAACSGALPQFTQGGSVPSSAGLGQAGHWPVMHREALGPERRKKV